MPRALDHGTMEPQGDVPPILPFGQQRSHLGFGKHGAHAADLHLVDRLEGLCAKCIQAVAQGLGHDLQEFSDL